MEEKLDQIIAALNRIADALENKKGDECAAQHNTPTEIKCKPIIHEDITIVKVRAVLIKKRDKSQQVRALLKKYNATRLTELNPDNYPAFLREAEAL